jgi:hypothetical protein
MEIRFYAEGTIRVFSSPIEAPVEIRGTLLIDFLAEASRAGRIAGIIREMVLESEDSEASVIAVPSREGVPNNLRGDSKTLCVDVTADVVVLDARFENALFSNLDFSCDSSASRSPELFLWVLSMRYSIDLKLVARPVPADANRFFRRSDVNGDAGIDVSDAVRILRFLFVDGTPLRCDDAADIDDDGAVNLVDAVVLLERLFLGKAFTAPPTECWMDFTEDALSCADPADCG